MKNEMTLTQLREKFDADSYSVKNGVFTVRRGFFISGGFSADAYAAKVLNAFPTATIVDKGEVWKPFRGGASVAQQSHWFVKFTLDTPKRCAGDSLCTGRVRPSGFCRVHEELDGE